jgi:ABC-2 type transport system ATP-binding protein
LIGGLAAPTSGAIFYNSSPIGQHRVASRFGFLPEQFLPYPFLSAWELLNLWTRAVGRQPNHAEEVARLLDTVGLAEQRHRWIRTYSRGMIQRLGIALALAGDPECLVLDEPALGLDLLGQQELLALLRRCQQAGKTILFSSHTISQVERIADRIGVLASGKLRFTGTVEELLKKHAATSLEEAFLKELAT